MQRVQQVDPNSKRTKGFEAPSIFPLPEAQCCSRAFLHNVHNVKPVRYTYDQRKVCHLQVLDDLDIFQLIWYSQMQMAEIYRVYSTRYQF